MASSTFNPGGTGPVTPVTAPAAPSTATPTVTPTTVTPSTTPTVPSTVTVPPVTPGAPAVASPTTPATPDPNAANIEVLRASHETLKSLGDISGVRDGLGVYQKVWTEAETLGKALEYTPESLQAAFKADPVGTINVLRQEKATLDARPRDPNADAIDAAVRRATQPLTEHLARQMADKHNATIDTEFTRMLDANDAFKPRGGVAVPPEVRELVHDRFIETIKWNQPILKEVMQGKVSGLQKIFDEVVTHTLKSWNSYQTWSGAPAPTTPTTGTRGADGKFVAAPSTGKVFDGNLDDIIEGTAKADMLPSMRGFK